MSTILLADDNSNIQKMVSLALKDQGIEVIAVGNGEAAVRKLRDMVPDLVLADIFMPVRNGYEVCEFVKGDTRLSHIPVVLLAGAFDPFDQNEAERVGANGVLKKPFVPPDPLVNLVKSLLPKPPDPPPADPASGEFVSNKVSNTWGSPLPSQAFAGTTMPPAASAPFVHAPVAVANPPATQGQPMASVQTTVAPPKPAVKEESPEPVDDPTFTQTTCPDLLDEMLGRSTDEESHAPKGRFGGVAAFPDMVEEAGPKTPEKNKFAPKPPVHDSFGDHEWPGQGAAVEEEEEPQAERPKSFRPSFLDKVDEAVIESKAKSSKKSAPKGIDLPKGLNFPAESEKQTPKASETQSVSKTEPKISWPSLDQALPQPPAAQAESKTEEPAAAQPIAAVPATFEPPTPEPAKSRGEKIEETQPQWNSYASVAAELDEHDSDKKETPAQSSHFSPWLPPQPAAPVAPAAPISIPRGADVEIRNTVKAVVEETAAAVDNFGKTSEAAEVKAETIAEAKAETTVAETTSTETLHTPAVTEFAVASTDSTSHATPEQSPTDAQSEHSETTLLGGATDMTVVEKTATPAPLAVAGPSTPASAQEDELVAEISARVMERMRPQVIDVITKEILRPIVEALVKKEIEEK